MSLILARRPACEVRVEGCKGRSTDVHERLTRARGGDILDETNCIAACGPCHMWVHDHPIEAHERGWLSHWWEGV